MQKALISLIFLMLCGCSTLEFPWVYRLDIEQGNIIKQEMVDQLKPGLSKSQVQFVMGTALIEDTFNSDRWDYLYTLRRGDGSYTRQRLTLTFDGDVLVGLSGDYLPGGAATGAATSN
jgi:outer membrane protein assembly factor BamE